MITVFLIIYVIIFILDYFLLKKFKILMINEYDYLVARFKLKDNEKDRKRSKIICSLINALIISLVSTFIIYIKWSLYLKFPLAFVLLVILIYSIYGLYGIILRSKQNGKKEKRKRSKNKTKTNKK